MDAKTVFAMCALAAGLSACTHRQHAYIQGKHGAIEDSQSGVGFGRADQPTRSADAYSAVVATDGARNLQDAYAECVRECNTRGNCDCLRHFTFGPYGTLYGPAGMYGGGYAPHAVADPIQTLTIENRTGRNISVQMDGWAGYLRNGQASRIRLAAHLFGNAELVPTLEGSVEVCVYSAPFHQHLFCKPVRYYFRTLDPQKVIIVDQWSIGAR